jgi:nucleotide-binding universal stress UspA family protein
MILSSVTPLSDNCVRLDTVNRAHPLRALGRIKATNPLTNKTYTTRGSYLKTWPTHESHVVKGASRGSVGVIAVGRRGRWSFQVGDTDDRQRSVAMFQRILVPLDGSFRAEQALPVAARIARASGGSLHLVQVVSPPVDYSGGLAPVPLFNEQVIESDIAAAAGSLRVVAASQVLAGIPTSTEVQFGFPAQQLIAAVGAHGIDLVVLCSHGRTGFTRWALGSVAHTLVNQSTVPVLVLREGEAASLLPRSNEPRTLCALVPLDGSPLAEAALAPAAHLVAALAAPAHGALHLAQVVKPFSTTVEEGFVSELNEEARQRASAYLATVAQRLQATESAKALSITSQILLEADVASALLTLAEHDGEGGCDLITISTHGRGGLERWVMGSVTERLLNAAQLPMLIVRPQKKG